jgi:hypothetical protein
VKLFTSRRNEINEAIEQALDGYPDALADIMDRPMFQTEDGANLIMGRYRKIKAQREEGSASWEQFVKDSEEVMY